MIFNSQILDSNLHQQIFNFTGHIITSGSGGSNKESENESGKYLYILTPVCNHVLYFESNNIQENTIFKR